jgi:predicted acetyltransferase
MNEDYIVIQPQLIYAEAIADAHADFCSVGEQKYIDLYEPAVKDFAAYIIWMQDLEKGINLPDGWVPETTRWLINSAKELGLGKVLVTCDADNIASKRIIETAGAQFENEIIPKGQSYAVRRYWLTI